MLQAGGWNRAGRGGGQGGARKVKLRIYWYFVSSNGSLVVTGLESIHHWSALLRHS